MRFPRVRIGFRRPQGLGKDSMKRKSLLLADDEQLILHSFSRDLASDALGVTLAANGEEAVDMIAGTHFDIVVTDLVMPGIDGFQVLKAAKKKGCADHRYHFDRLWRYRIRGRCVAIGSR